MVSGDKQKQIERRSVSLYPEDWLEIDTLDRASGSGVSGALRRIVREWRELRDPAETRKAIRLRQLAGGFAAGQLTEAEFAQEAMLLGMNGEAPAAGM